MLDLVKAFDIVNLGKLLAKLGNMASCWLYVTKKLFNR